MLKHFRGSPLWLIGLFVIFAEGISAIAAIQLDGWKQGALVIFVIAYASLVTLMFFAFLWKKPENFYSPVDYASTTPQEFVHTLRGSVPTNIADAVANLREDPNSKSKRFRLLANLLPEEAKQHLVLMAKTGNPIHTTTESEHGLTHHYQFLQHNGGMSLGWFSPLSFLRHLDGTDTVILTGDKKEIKLLPEGEEFANWLIDNKLDASSFQSEIGGWGEKFDPAAIMKKHLESNA